MVIRVNKNKDYTVMSNYHLRDKNISLKGKGLLSQILSLPEDWNYTIQGLVAINQESKTSIQTTLKELEENGYLKRERVQNAKGQFGYVYDIYEQPFTTKQKTEKPRTENLCTDNLYTDNLCTENRPQLNTDILNTDILNTKKTNTEKKKGCYDSAIDEYTDNSSLKDTIQEFLKMRKLIKKPMTERGLTLLLNKLNELGEDDDNKIAILNQSIVSNWQSIYPLKDKPKQKKSDAEIFGF